MTDAEQALFDSLPGPPVRAVLKPTNLWIVEWLPSNEQCTGRLLHEWIQERRVGWSVYSKCASKQAVLSSIERATNRSENSRMIPVLHLEAHGDENGLGGPDDNGGEESLMWQELTEPLQELNLVTRCNLIVVVASCVGYAGIKLFDKGPRAPAIALIGPDAPIISSRLLSATKEIYRRLMDDENPNIDEILISASREAGGVSFEPEPFTVFAYETLAELLINLMRKDHKHKQVKQNLIQEMWDKMFMIDLYPENREKFGVNWAEIVDIILCNQS